MKVKWKVHEVQFRGELWVIVGGKGIRGYRWKVEGVIKTERSIMCSWNRRFNGMVRRIGFRRYLNTDRIWIAF